MNEENKIIKTINIVIYVFIGLFLLYGLYAFGRGILAALNIIKDDGLQIPFNIIFGASLIFLSALYIVNKLTEKGPSNEPRRKNSKKY